MDDPRRAIVEVMARLGRETQLHMDERRHHFKVTDKVILAVSVLLSVVAVFNVYFVWVLSRDMDGIVTNMDSMRQHLIKMDEDMGVITDTVGGFDDHLTYMYVISSNVGDLAANLPLIRINLDSMTQSMKGIDFEMNNMHNSISHVGNNINHMTRGMSGMENNMRQFSAPMGILNPMFP